MTTRKYEHPYDSWLEVYWVIREGSEDEARAALDRKKSEGVRIDHEYVDELDQSCLHWAVARMPGLVGELLEAGAFPNSRDGDGQSPISLAAEKGREEAFFSMVEAGADISSMAEPMLLHAAAYGGSDRIIEACLAVERDVEYRNRDGKTALHLAALGGSSKAARILLREGADPNAVDARDRTPMHDAALRGIEARRSRAVLNPIHACQAYFTEDQMSERLGDLPAVLLGAGADPDAKDSRGDTPLHIAARLGDVERSVFLLDAGADPSIMNDDGAAPDALAEKPELKTLLSVAREARELELVSKSAAPEIIGRRRKI